MAVRTNFMLLDFINGTSDLSISATDLTNITKQIISTDGTVLYLKHKYGTRFYPVLRGSNTADENDAYSDFCQDFRSWVNNRQHNIDKMYQALFDYEYSPIENVDRYETETTDRDIDTTYGRKNTQSGSDALAMTGTVTNTGTDTVATSGTDSVTKSGNIVNETDVAGFNAPQSFTNDSKNTETYNNVKDKTDFGKTETDTKNLTETHNRTDTTTYGKVDTQSGTDATNDDTLRTLRVHGNIGVTTNNQLINQELEMRMMSLAEMLLDNFINDYTFYA